MPDKLKQVITFLLRENKRLSDEVAALSHTVNDVIVKSLVEANDQYEYDTGLEAFRGAHPEIADLDPKLKALYGDDYDTAKQFYDNRPSEYDEGMDENGWVAAMLESINAKLTALTGIETPVDEGAAEVPEETVVEETTEATPEVPEEQADIPVVDEEQLKAELKAARGE